MLAIQTSFVARTEKKPAKVVAKMGISKVSVEWKESIPDWCNHANAVMKICAELNIRAQDYRAGIFGDSYYWVAEKSEMVIKETDAPAQEPAQAPTDVPAIPHAADPQSAPMEGSTALPEPAPEPAKPARVRRAA